ncbi:MAG: ectonucleotide pyrophosphatase/phosphodiesterase [Clostridia bacterium]|nr:ectonucleotide pyrophosphatase/phosphodiesterase [Clostridia bacterium]
MKKDRRILVFSVDAMVAEDVDILRTKPNFQKYIAGGAEVKTVKTVYPSVTYPAHTSMITGAWPAKHGVISNFAFTTDSKEDTWQWDAEAIRIPDIFTAAKKAGYTTGSVFWPVTGNHKYIDYLIDEYWLPEKDQTLRTGFAKMGSSAEMLDIIEKNEGELAPSYKLTGRKNFCIYPEIDNFLMANAVDVIRKYAPEVMFVHNGNIDHQRHVAGVFSEVVKDALDIIDYNIGQLGEALEAAGVLADTDFFLVSDHGQRQIVRTVKLNVLLKDAGLIDVDEKGKVTDYRAYCFSNAMSSFVYLKNPGDRGLCEMVGALLRGLCREGIYGIGKVLTRGEAEKLGVTGDFSFMIESDGYTSFSDSCKRPIVPPMDLSDFRFGRATHGYYPEVGPQPVFLGKGPHIAEGFVLERTDVINEAPTYAALLGVELPDAEGKAIEGFLKD